MSSERKSLDATAGSRGGAAYKDRYERDYLERTIATVRNHRDAKNCWPQWANIFADEIERLWAVEATTDDAQASSPKSSSAGSSE